MKIIRSSHFKEEVEILRKKYRKIETDLTEFESTFSLSRGIPLGQDIFKFRFKNSSIPTGQRGGFRIVLLMLDEETTLLLSVYAKTLRSDLRIEEIEEILEKIR